MIFSIFQVSRDCKRLLTASVRHLSSVVYCKKGHCLETVVLRDHSTAVICSVRKRWLTGFTVMLVVMCSETDSVKFKVQVYNVRKLSSSTIVRT